MKTAVLEISGFGECNGSTTVLPIREELYWNGESSVFYWVTAWCLIEILALFQVVLKEDGHQTDNSSVVWLGVGCKCLGQHIKPGKKISNLISCTISLPNNINIRQIIPNSSVCKSWKSWHMLTDEQIYRHIKKILKRHWVYLCLPIDLCLTTAPHFPQNQKMLMDCFSS